MRLVLGFTARNPFSRQFGATRVYSSHLFEHMDYSAGQSLLRDVRRVLVPGGEVSVCVPNARLYIDAYLGVSELDLGHDFWEPALSGRDGISLVNYVAYMGVEHKCLFDMDSLLKRLRDVGFVNVQERSFDESIDLPKRAFESIYARASSGDTPPHEGHRTLRSRSEPETH